MRDGQVVRGAKFWGSGPPAQQVALTFGGFGPPDPIPLRKSIVVRWRVRVGASGYFSMSIARVIAEGFPQLAPSAKIRKAGSEAWHCTKQER